MDTDSEYRPDIDGLRAVAVLAVIVFHIDKTILPGGFVGVDIFFVISGHLITLQVMRQIRAGTFSIAEFYRRRIKRIAPAMLAVVAATVVLAQLIMLPDAARETAKAGFWSVLSMPNVHFWLTEDLSYFAAASTQKPLLHLWSLGVEEQFYGIWPLVLLAVRKLSLRVVVVGTAIAIVASILLAQAAFGIDPSFAYFMLITRAGELLIGALVAMAAISGRRSSGTLGAWAGAALLFASFALLHEDSVFPGWLALPPTIGAALLIFQPTSPLSSLLSIPQLVFVGKISYSAYLWHWPLLAFLRYGHPQPLTFVQGIGVLIATLFLAYISSTLLELPARRVTWSARAVILRQFVVPAAVLCAVCIVAVKLDGHGLRSAQYARALERLDGQAKAAFLFDYVCQRRRLGGADIENGSCVLGDRTSPVKVLLWGDSNAAHYVGMVATFAEHAGFALRNAEVDACPPIDVDPAPYVATKRLDDCRHSYAIARRAIQEAQIVVLGGSWTAYQERSGDFLDALFTSVKRLRQQGKQVVILGKAPIIHSFDKACRQKALSYPLLECDHPGSMLSADVLHMNARLQQFAGSMEGVSFFDVAPYICEAGRCMPFDRNGLPLYHDPSHIAASASWRIGREILAREGMPRAFQEVLCFSQGSCGSELSPAGALDADRL